MSIHGRLSSFLGSLCLFENIRTELAGQVGNQSEKDDFKFFWRQILFIKKKDPML
ncbi:hypothetical protein HY229_05920 [Candidatus Acetothermia bacterium]|nr:hypothetical protein [Candidatus Acetothermia bacterium]MBI3643620.1 hypothetical protein [Candidatus Acetothermia bacterium]